MADESLRGRFVWHELLTTNTASAATFYRKIVGWKSAPWPTDAAYTLFMSGEQPVAGLMLLPAEAKQSGAPPNWVTYIGTASVDETARRLTQLGGKVLKPAEDVPTAGRFAIVQDPQGAVFGLYTPAQSQPGGGQPKVGEFSWHELATDDPIAAWSFYQTLFGWEKTSAMDMGPEVGTYQMFGWNGQSVGGMMRRPPNMTSYWMPYAMIADARAAAKTVVQLGGRIANGPMEVPGGDWIFNGIDLQGAAFSVHSRTAAAKPAARPAPKKAAAAAKKTAKPRRAQKAAAKKSARSTRKSRGSARKASKKGKKPARRPARKSRGKRRR